MKPTLSTTFSAAVYLFYVLQTLCCGLQSCLRLSVHPACLAGVSARTPAGLQLMDAAVERIISNGAGQRPPFEAERVVWSRRGEHRVAHGEVGDELLMARVPFGDSLVVGLALALQLLP